MIRRISGARSGASKSKVLLFQPPAGSWARGGLPKWRLHRTIDYMMDHLDRPLSLPELAANVELSQFHFCRMFKKSTNLTPHQYVLQLRIERARDLLTGRLPLAEIAAQLGFADQSHFGAVFKRFLGITPSEFLRSA